MNIQSKLLLLAVAMLAVPQVGLAGGPGSVIQTACAGNFAGGSCSVGGQGGVGGKTSVGIGLNAVGSKATYNIGNFAANGSFGEVQTVTTKSLGLPNASDSLLNSIRLYTFTPTQGSGMIKNQQQDLLFVAFDLTKSLPSWTPAYVVSELNDIKNANSAAKSAVYVYRHIKGEPATQWTELGKAVSDAAASDLANPAGNVKFTITPEAKVTIQLNPIKDASGNTVTPEPITGDLGKVS